MIKAMDFIGNFKNVYKIKYNGEILYNILLDEHSKINVNNLMCETLHPNNVIAILYREYLLHETKSKIIEGLELYNKCINNKRCIK